jgi:CheY-like chemotaxis protein
VSVFVVEDSPKDLSLAVKTARAAGFTEIDARSSLESAQSWLVKRLQGKLPLPIVIVVDLDLGLDSGYELLRFRHATPAMSNVQIIVWTQLGDENRQICELFGVEFYIPKWKGANALQEALQEVNPTGRHSSAPGGAGSLREVLGD